jgi:hypothetical protein
MTVPTVECPCCEELLVGVDMEEALAHLVSCCNERGYYVLGVKPRHADLLYEDLTGSTPPKMEMHDRIKYYWDEHSDADHDEPDPHGDDE